ncbi:MAG: hypothetical protein LBV34_25135 [Nocardiopsaceae bacterium]|nr:hypothetical protein [Nocardiopsaceae bacterium]
MIGATLVILGVLSVLFAPVLTVVGCPNPGFCREQGASDWWGLINYPPGWGKLFFPMLIIGVAFVVTGIVLLIRSIRHKRSPSTAR